MSIGNELRGVLCAEALAARRLGQRGGVVSVLRQLAEQFETDPAARGHRAAAVKALLTVGGSGDDGVDYHVARAGVKGVDRLRRRAGGEDGHVADAADVLQQHRLTLAAVEEVFRKRHERRALSAGGHVRHAEVRYGGDARALGDDRAFAYLHRAADVVAVLALELRRVPDGLAVGGDEVHVAHLQPGGRNDAVRRAGEELAEQEVHITEPVRRRLLRVEEGEYFLPYGLGVRRVAKPQQPHRGRLRAAAELDEGGVDAVHRGAGHEAHGQAARLISDSFQHVHRSLSVWSVGMDKNSACILNKLHN